MSTTRGPARALGKVTAELSHRYEGTFSPETAAQVVMAAGFMSHLSGGRVRVRSAGSQPGERVNPIAAQAMAEVGVNLSEAFPKPLTNDVVRAADVIVTMGCGDACPCRRYTGAARHAVGSTLQV